MNIELSTLTLPNKLRSVRHALGGNNFRMRARNTMTFVILAAALSQPSWAQDFEQEPISYGKTAPLNRFSQLLERLEAGKTQLDYEPHFGYLRSLLGELKVPESSQVLVFSKTSLQRQRISPRTPRALYFNDDIYIGFCQQGEVLEVSAVDPQLGAVFYTIQQEPSDRPRVVRQSDNCLICHASSQTKGVPGHLVRSVFADSFGMPILAAGTYRVDHMTPLEHRWGGWYVTGTHGAQKHLGNLAISGGQVPNPIDNTAGMNVTDLATRLDTSAYLTGHSDLVALMVLEHQTDAHNLITQANFSTRQASHHQDALNRELNEPADRVWESTRTRIKSACEPLVEYLFFSGETQLTHPVQGTSGFAQQFVQQGPRDKHGRSLRDLDLKTRLFRFPCSYLIYSPSFNALPGEAKGYVLQRMWEIVAGEDTSKQFAHLTPDDRRAIREIVRDTIPNLPNFWQTDTGQ